MTLWDRVRGTLYLIRPMLLLIAALVLLGRAFYYVIPPISPYLLSYVKTYVALPAGLAVAALVYWVVLTRRDARLLHKIILGISIAAVVGTGVAVGLWTLYQYNCVARLRPERDYYHCNFTGKDLSNRDMHGSDLTQALLGGTNLSGTNLAGTNLRGQDLHTGMLSEADLSEAILAEAILTSADLRGVIAESADLTGADLSNADLRDCQLSKAKLNNATLEGTTLSGCDLSGANLSKLDLSTASLKGVNLTRANLQGANLVNLDLQGIILDEADLQQANLTGSQLDGASLKNANLQDTHLTNTNLSRANLEQVLAQDADLSQAELRGANLTSANFSGASLAGCHLQGATVAGADFSGSDLSKADLEGLDLQEAQLTEAILSSANLTNANLSALDLRSVDLSGAVLIGANLEDANLSGSEYHDLQLQQAILSGADLSDARFEDCQFNQANLSGATLTDANLSGNDLTDVNLQPAVLSRTVPRETILEGASLKGLDLHSAVFSKTILKDADLEDADLSGRDLSGVDFRDSDLRNANLTEANLSFADLSNAKLGGANFSNCNLEEADLSDQDLTQVVITDAMLSGVDFSGANLTRLNLFGMDLYNADLTGADIRQADLRKANLQYVKLANSILDGADLRKADLNAADFKGASMEGALLDYANCLDATNLSEETEDSASGAVNGTRFQNRDAIMAALGRVCQGKGVEDAASYDAASGLRPVVLLDKNGFSHMWSDYLPSAWEPTGIRFAQLVACIGPQESTIISSTPYCLGTSYCSNPTYLKRYRYRLEVEIRRAREGALLAKQTFYGDAPRSAERTESWAVVNTGLWGSDVFYSVIENWIRGIIAPRIFECKDAIGCVEVVPGAPLEIGVAFAFSGLYEYLGLEALRGIEIASEDIGDVLGHPIRLVESDSMCSEEGGKAAGEYFIENEWLIGAIGTTCGEATDEVSAALSEAGRVLISPSISTAWLTDPAYHQNGFLRVIPNDIEQAKLVAEFAYRKLGARTMATIHEGSRYGGDLQALACETFSKLGGECLMQEETNASAADLYRDLTRIAEQSPDVLYFPVLVDTAASLVKEARKLDALVDTDLIGSDTMFGQYFIENAGSAAKGIYLSGLLIGSEYYTSAYDGFLERFNERYGKLPDGLFHAYAYDALLLLTNAIEKVAVKEPNGTIHIPLQGLRNTLYNTRYLTGLTGQLNCNAQGDCGARNILRILQIVNTAPASFSPGSEEGDNPKMVYP